MFNLRFTLTKYLSTLILMRRKFTSPLDLMIFKFFQLELRRIEFHVSHNLVISQVRGEQTRLVIRAILEKRKYLLILFLF